jgi:succinate-acetate transporter protein
MGLLALGNVFGELVLCDYGGTWLDCLGCITDNFAERETLGLHVMPQVCDLL